LPSANYSFLILLLKNRTFSPQIYNANLMSDLVKRALSFENMIDLKLLVDLNTQIL